MGYMNELYGFLEEVSVNNNRGWFASQKQTYERLRKEWLDDIDRMIAAMSVWEPSLRGQTAKSSAYRFYRDTRFSPDKSPFKTYFSAAMGPKGKKSGYGCYYIETGIRNDNGLYGGIWCPDVAVLKKLRHAIVDNIEEFEGILDEPSMKKLYPGWIGQQLKTVPKGWAKDHPNAEYLRLKDYGKAHFVAKEFFLDKNWPEEASELFRVLKPFIDFLNYSIDE
ncbi:MAG: DUF2461 domain-containing protein [Paramuribaculum sp.]|nr:DUF2461 domain-containing protein [Paramuribaculum sp.]